MCTRSFQVFLLLVCVVPLCNANTASTSVNVQDPNEYTPEFHSAISSFNISQGDYTDQPLLITQVEAFDEDEGFAGNVTYNITGLSPADALDKFSLAENGQLTLKSLVTVGDLYVLVIEACDHGFMKRRDHSVLIISVVSEWSGGPEFPTDMYHVSVSEGVNAQSHIVRVQALDPNVNVQYSIVGGNDDGAFTISDTTGVIRTTKALSAADKSEYSLTVAANDPDGKSAFTKVEIRVSPNVVHQVPDCNCSALNTVCTPLAPKLYIADVSENITLDSVIFMMPKPEQEQTNDTTVDTTKFDIIGGNDDGEFSIDQSTGDVSILKILNATMYDLTITATTPDGKVTESTLRVLKSPINPRLQNDEDTVMYMNDGRDVVLNNQCQCPNASPQNFAIPPLVFALSLFLLPFLA